MTESTLLHGVSYSMSHSFPKIYNIIYYVNLVESRSIMHMSSPNKPKKINKLWGFFTTINTQTNRKFVVTVDHVSRCGQRQGSRKQLADWFHLRPGPVTVYIKEFCIKVASFVYVIQLWWHKPKGNASLEI